MKPILDVIICTHNRMGLVLNAIGFLENQSLPSDKLRIVIVGNATPQDQLRALDDYRKQSSANIDLVLENKLGLSHARNAGMDAAVSDMFAFVDDDFEASPDWAKGIVSGLEDDRFDIIGGKVSLKFKDCEEPIWLSDYHRRLLGFNIRPKQDVIAEGKPHEVFGCNFAISRRVFDEIGGFSPDFGRIGISRGAGEESHFVKRALQEGFSIGYQPQADGFHLVTEDRLKLEYLRQCAEGAGSAYIQLQALDREFTQQDLQNEILRVNEFATLEQQMSGVDYKSYCDSYTRRFESISRATTVLRLIHAQENASPQRVSNTPTGVLDKAVEELQEAYSVRTRESIAGIFGALVRSGLPQKFIDSCPDALVTVIVTTHNNEAHIASCLKSILLQSHPRLDCIVIDAASTDATCDIIGAFAQCDQRVQLVRLVDNCGPGHARNIGISKAVGEFTCFLDGDDLMMQDSILLRLAAAHRYNFGSVAGSYCGFRTASDIDSSFEPATKSSDPKNKRILDFIAASGDSPCGTEQPLVRTSILRETGGFATNFQYNEDWDLWYRLLRNGYVFVACGYDALLYRQRASSLTKNSDLNNPMISLSLVKEAYEEVQPDFFVTNAPYRFHKPLHYYQSHLVMAQRVISSPAFAQAQTEDEIRQLLCLLPQDLFDLIIHQLNVVDILTFGAKRIVGETDPDLNKSRLFQQSVIDKANLIRRAYSGAVAQPKIRNLERILTKFSDPVIHPPSHDYLRDISSNNRLYGRILAADVALAEEKAKLDASSQTPPAQMTNAVHFVSTGTLIKELPRRALRIGKRVVKKTLRVLGFKR